MMSRSLLARCILTAAMLISARDPAAAQVIVGRVIDSSYGIPVARATVSATAEGSAEQRVYSDDDGRFIIPLQQPGTYRLIAARDGYRDSRGRPITLRAGDTARVELRVTPAPVALRTLGVTARKQPLAVRGRFRRTKPDTTAVAAWRAEGQRRAIRVRGAFPTPSVCNDLGAAADRTDPVVTLVIEARPGRSNCSDKRGAFTYAITLRELPAGTYTLRVFHALRTRPGERLMVLDTAVAVR